MGTTTDHGHGAHGDGHGELGHVVPFKIYMATFLALVVLTVITVVISRFDFGNMNIIVAMLIASVKAALVMLFFMHVRYENPLLWLYIAIPIMTLVVMFGGIFMDNPTRIQGVPFPQTVESLKPAVDPNAAAAPAGH